MKRFQIRQNDSSITTGSHSICLLKLAAPNTVYLTNLFIPFSYSTFPMKSTPPLINKIGFTRIELCQNKSNINNKIQWTAIILNPLGKVPSVIRKGHCNKAHSVDTCTHLEVILNKMSTYNVARSVTHNFSRRLNPIAKNLLRAPKPDRILFDSRKRPVMKIFLFFQRHIAI